jgi:hypothetical protein
VKLVFALASVMIPSLIACGPSVSGHGDDDDGSGADGGPNNGNCHPSVEICSGGGDEDCDGLVDCDDADCDGQPACANASNCGTIEHPEASLALPDGDGVSYTSAIMFTQFGAGQALANVNQFLGVCVNMEHSWARDLQIEITCPSGKTVVLHNFGGRTGGEVFVGIPNDTDDVDPVPGTGEQYCWTPTATNPTWLEYANQHDPTGFSTVMLPPGDYRSYSPMSDLTGCTLNGTWTLKVTDDWPYDNGFIFSWGLKFDPSIVQDCSTWPPVG